MLNAERVFIHADALQGGAIASDKHGSSRTRQEEPCPVRAGTGVNARSCGLPRLGSWGVRFAGCGNCGGGAFALEWEVGTRTKWNRSTWPWAWLNQSSSKRKHSPVHMLSALSVESAQPDRKCAK